MKFLWIRATLDLTYGGPVAAITQLTLALRELGHPCEVVTLDAPHTSGVDAFPGVVHALGPSRGTYGYNTRLAVWLRQNVTRFDAVIVSGIWQYPSFAVWLASRKMNFPYFVFIHGALNPWFKRTYPLKHLKKWLYWPWAEYQVLRDASAVLFTNEGERKSASKSFWLYKANEVVVNYGVGSPQGDPDDQRQVFLDKFPHLRGKHFLLFLGRIHPVKGCDMLIDAFVQIARQYLDLHLVMAGPDQEKLLPALIDQAAQQGMDGRITWTGMLNGDLKWGAYHAADVFVLPSHSENFGIVVAEALASSLPVLITDKVNIWREIQEDNAGLVAPDTPEGIARLLREWLLLSQDERQKMRTNARNCFLNRYEIKMVAGKFAGTIGSLLEDHSRHIQGA
jgi:glycosyltransferase involved in cell wall biosynthesis